MHDDTMINIALSQYGQAEINGDIHNPAVVNYFWETGHKYINNDETPWCSAFMSWCAYRSNMEMSHKLDARSWLDVGIETKEPKVGDIVVFWRDNKKGWKGHVGLYISESEAGMFINVLGGNQDDKVSIKQYPKSKLLGYRRLKKRLI